MPITKNGAVVAHKTAFFGDIHVGGPERQPFSVVFDTGSGHVILPGSACTSETCKAKRRFDHSKSSSARNVTSKGDLKVVGDETRENVAITFGTGKVNGEFLRDTVCLQEKGACIDLSIVAANEMTQDPFDAFSFDGVLGLSLSRLSLAPSFNFFGQMASQSQADFLPQFAVFLSSQPSVPSEISFGGYDESRLAGPLNWSPVLDPQLGYWQVPIKAVKIGRESLPLCEKGGCRAILDSGTSLLGVPSGELRSFHRQLARVLPEEHEDVDCRQWEGPPISFDLGSFSVTVTAEDYSRMSPASLRVAGGKPDQKRDFCRASLLPVDLKAPLGPATFIMGEPILKRFYTVFDWGQKRVGLGLAKQTTPEASAASHGTAEPALRGATVV